MLLAELMCTDGADFDWTSYLPVLFHFCLMNFDNSKQIVGEHAKKLLLGVLYVLTVQSELFNLTEILLDSLPSVIDNQSVIFDRKYTTLSENAWTRSKLSSANCHYNFNFNLRMGFVKGGLFKTNFETNTGVLHHRTLANLHSAPSSPGQNKPNQSSSHIIMNPASTISSAPITAAATVNSSPTAAEKTASLKLTKKVNKMHQAKEYLTNLLSILSRSKNSPVWPYEFVTPHNYSRTLTSILVLNEFIHNLKNFIQICFSTKQISTISSASTRSFSSPIDLTTRFHHSSKKSDTALANIDKKWSNYALITSLSNSISHHYAARSLQIYRALGVRIESINTMVTLVRRLVETIADPNEDLQSYVTEILLTLKMNAAIITEKYVESISMSGNGINSNSGATATPTADKNELKDQQNIKQKSKSLQVY